MERIAPQILRQRYLIEGFYNRKVDTEVLEEYLDHITKSLKLKRHGPSLINSQEKSNYNLYAPLVDSGISIYVWPKEAFLSIIFLNGKSFDEKRALEKTCSFFQIKDYISKNF